MAIASQLQLRRGTTPQHAVFTGAPGEVTVDTDKKTVVVHDGATAGGFPLSRESTVNILNFGADPTGVADSVSAIQAAINAAPNGSEIVFPEGTYRIVATPLVAPIEIPFAKQNLILRGDGAILKCADGYFPHIMRVAGTGTVIDGLRFDGSYIASGPGATPDRTSYAIATAPGSPDFAGRYYLLEINGIDITVQNSRIFDVQGVGIHIGKGVGSGVAAALGSAYFGTGPDHAVTGTRLINNRWINVYQAGANFGSTLTKTQFPSLIPGKNFLAAYNHIKDNSWEMKSSLARAMGLVQFADAYETGGAVFVGNIIQNGGTTGIEAFGEHNNVVVNGNYIEGGDIAISLGGVDRFTVTGNVAIGARNYEIELALSHEGTVTGNYVSNRRADGTFPPASETLWSGGTGPNAFSGISLSGAETLRNITVTGNTAVDVNVGLFCNVALDNFVASSNTFELRSTSSAQNGIMIQGSANRSVSIVNNIVRARSSNLTTAIRLGAAFPALTTWAPSLVINNGTYVWYNGGPAALNGVYFCKTTHTSAASFATDWNNGNGVYNLVAKEWITGTTYTERDSVVSTSGILYKVALPHTAGTFSTDVANGLLMLNATRGGIVSNNIIDGGWAQATPIAIGNAQQIDVKDNAPMGFGDRSFELNLQGSTVDSSGGLLTYVTADRSGTASITAANTSVSVTHGLGYTPAASDIEVTPTNNLGSATKWHLSSITGSSFAITVNAAPGAGNTADFAWRVRRRGMSMNSAWLSVPGSAASGWSRLVVPFFNFIQGSATGVFTRDGFILECGLQTRAEAMFKTSFYIGGQGTETGGDLAARGFRVSIAGNGSTFNVVAAIHNGTSETTASGTFGGTLQRIIIQWAPLTLFVGASIPNVGSRLIVSGEDGTGARRQIAVAELSSSLGNTLTAGSHLVIVTSSDNTAPAYTTNFEIGPLKLCRAV